MFSFLKSEKAKARDEAKAWLALGKKVWHYRRDVLPESAEMELRAQIEALNVSIRNRVETADLKLAVEALERVLSRTGGVYYPRSSWQDNIEFFLYAAIFVIGLRVFFAQPFKIPTNSMWPSYAGMRSEVFTSPDKEPSVPMQLVRAAAFGARTRRVDAAESGKVYILAGVRRASSAEGDTGQRVQLSATPRSGRSFLVFPTTHAVWTVRTGNKGVEFQTPAEFSGEMNQVFAEAFFPSAANLQDAVLNALAQGRAVPAQPGFSVAAKEGLFWIETEKTVTKGERLLAFDILGGDHLFVDRMSYHFRKPAVGDSFVFRTGNIPRINQDQYYIKRLVGAPGDRLEVVKGALLRNGSPAEGADAFLWNARKEQGFAGYTNFWSLAPGRSVTVAPGEFYAMGDNSPQSSDSRNWGGVPAKDVVGTPLFVFYPFTRRLLGAP